MFILASILFVLISIPLYLIFSYTKKKQGLENIPMPITKYILGHVLEVKSTTDAIKAFYKYTSEYGPTVQLRVIYQPVLVTMEKELIEMLLSSNRNLTKSENYTFLTNWLGTGLIINTGDSWRHDRKILTPAFHFEILKDFVYIFEKVGDVLVEKLGNLSKEPSVDVAPILSLCTLDAICETAMGVAINVQSGENVDYVSAVQGMCRLTIERGLSGYQLIEWIYRLTPQYIKEKKFLKTLHGFTKNVIKNRRRSNSSSKKRLALLDLMLKYSEEGKNVNIQNQVDTFMFAGHDTTSSAISFTLHCLAENPKAQELAFQEQFALFGTEKNPEITHQNLQDMRYLELVIKESLRLYPPVPIIGRCLDEHLKYKNHTIQKGLNVGVWIYGMHRNPEYYPNPEKFEPERFECFEPPPFTYLPFSAGPRNCIGFKFAMLELKSIVGKIIRNFEVVPAFPRHELVLSIETVLTSATGVKISFRKR